MVLVLVDRTLTSGETPNHTGAITIIRTWLQEYLADGSLLAVGHRVCPTAGNITQHPVLINPTVLAELEALVPLAPLHQPHNLATIRALLENHADIAASGVL
jgi:acetate kinase